MKWTLLVSDDEPFAEISSNWEYLFGDNRTFDNVSYTDLTDASRPDVGVGQIQAIMRMLWSDIAYKDGAFVVRDNAIGGHLGTNFVGFCAGAIKNIVNDQNVEIKHFLIVGFFGNN